MIHLARLEVGGEHCIYYRSGTQDEAVIKEVITNHCYRRAGVGFDVEPGEHWLDLGAHIGSFALYCAVRGATATCYEADRYNHLVLARNVQGRRGFAAHHAAVTASTSELTTLWMTARGDSRRHTVLHTPRAESPVSVPNVYAGDLLPPGWAVAWDGVKMDIEGSEMGMLDAALVPPCRKLVLEYHTSRDRSAANLKRRLDVLKDIFPNVLYPAEYDRLIGAGGEARTYFDRLVFCWH